MLSFLQTQQSCRVFSGAHSHMAGNMPASGCLILAGCLKGCIKILPENTQAEIGKINAFSSYTDVRFFIHALARPC